MEFAILDLNAKKLRTFPKAMSLESFAGCLWNFEKRTTNSKASELIKEYTEFYENDKIDLSEVAHILANNLTYSKHHLVINKISASSKDLKIICKALELIVDNVIIDLLNRDILTN